MTQIQLLQLSLEDFKDLLSDVVHEQMKQYEKETPEQLLTRKEVAKRLDISLPSLHKYTELGILIQHKIGERVYYRWDEVLAAAKKVESKNTYYS